MIKLPILTDEPQQLPILQGLDYTEQQVDNTALLQISLSTSRRCNLACGYCFSNGGIPRENELSTQERKDILEGASKMGAKTWYLAGDGEPFLDPDLFDLIDYAKKNGLYSVIFTNGTVLDEEIIQRVKERDVSLIIKWNSTRQEIFDEVTNDHVPLIDHDGVNIPAALDKCIRAGMNELSPTRVGVETVVLRQNQDEIDSMIEFCQKHNVYPHTERMFRSGRAIHHPHWFPTTQNELPSHLPKNYCGQRPFYSMVIRSDGEAYICFSYHQDMHLGSARDQTLEQLIENRNAKVQELLQRFPKTDCLCASLTKALE